MFSPNRPACLSFTYRNWKGEVSERRATVYLVYYGSTEFHPEPQWLMSGYDVDKQTHRTYAVKDMTDVKIED